MQTILRWGFYTSVNATRTCNYTTRGNQSPVIVYTDGSYKNKKCGIGVYFPEQEKFPSRELSKKIEHHRLTNQVAELIACIYAIQIAQENSVSHVEIRTDSEYAVNSMKKWVHQWKTNDWKRVGTKCDIKNKDLIVELDNLCTCIKVDWVHIPRNQNKRANYLAQEATKH